MAFVGGLRSIPRIISQTNSSPTGSIIFLHGSGDTGDGVREWMKLIWKEEITFPHLKIIYPTAPERPYTPLNGRPSTVWFDRLMISPTAKEHESVDQMCHVLSGLIQEEVNSGIPKNRIALGGFSMGGAMAMTLAYKYHSDVAGVFALSSFLNNDASTYKTLNELNKTEQLPPLFQCHGERDELSSIEWAKYTHKNLISLGVTGEFHTFNIYHEFNKKELTMWRDWILKILPHTT